MKRREAERPPARRCAIYTRKSSEEGLDQAFNSLHAQREACEAYVLSQAGEGWSSLDDTYDDGGWSGGSLDRPAMQRLLSDIERGHIDVVVVYKIDRLTRSLTDFARIVEVFERHGVSFVSVTQAFNTTTSMGRLTLNVLLSFAQFEREVTGERIRDKIAASKKKGMWMGGVLPLGYDRPIDRTTRALVIHEVEAATVRQIFALYLKLGSVHVVQRRLEAEGVRSKRWVSSRGRVIGGAVLVRGALFHLLRNRVYLGDITHKGQVYPGAHEPIVEARIFEAVQAKLTSAARRHKSRPKRVDTMALKGLIFDGDANPMSPTFTHKGRDKVYRYYVSAPLQQGLARARDGVINRVPADDIEDLVRASVRRLLGLQEDEELPPLRALIGRVEVHANSVQLLVSRKALFARRSDPHQELATLARRLGGNETINAEETDASKVRLTIACRLRLRGGRSWITAPDGRRANAAPRIDRVLVQALRSAHALLSDGAAVPIGNPEAASLSRAPAKPYDRKLVRLAFLAPEIQREILEGRQAAGLTLEQLMHAHIPACWERQKALFG